MCVHMFNFCFLIIIFIYIFLHGNPSDKQTCFISSCFLSWQPCNWTQLFFISSRVYFIVIIQTVLFHHILYHDDPVA